ncbi:MAG: hypothetical protein KGJ51_10310, partial [Acidobacteriota bacterium]|nr:hypothetical protein [Acidobacteriota bacterium]
MKFAFTTRALVIGIALLIAGIVLGGGSAYWYAVHKEAAARQTAASPGQQASSQAGSMDNMPGMDMSGKQAKGSTAGSGQDMSNMPGMDMSGGSGDQAASMANMTPGTVMLDAATQQK